eukprot:TRINITY_DN1731_c0_g1_i1.p1 TRINITY_DN1731_c0_g1~~TRINITY_DN1731_c0_g1_i1.p1  ORF type:complete len:3325 (+),score=634.57 TRINITY_DN1731_c0_g1_i1:113-10087(+)
MVIKSMTGKSLRCVVAASLLVQRGLSDTAVASQATAGDLAESSLEDEGRGEIVEVSDGLPQAASVVTSTDCSGLGCDAADGGKDSAANPVAGESKDAAARTMRPSPKIEEPLASASPRAASASAAEDEVPEKDARRLVVISADLMPNATSFFLMLQGDENSMIPCNPNSACKAFVDGVYAGLTITSTEIILTDPDVWGSPAKTSARLRVVRGSVDEAAAQAGACIPGNNELGAHAGVVSEGWATLGTETTVGIPGDPTPSNKMVTQSPLTFLMGGNYTMCYSDDGTFLPGHADVLPSGMNVYGVYDVSRPGCSADDTCLTKREYHCYLLRKRYNNYQDSLTESTSCVVDYSYAGAGFEGPPGKGSWSETWTASYRTQNGVLTSMTPKACTTTPEDFLCKDGSDCSQGDPFTSPNPAVAYKQMPLPVASNQLDGATFRAHTVAACYCPDYSSCDNPTDYLQQIGILHYYVSKVCQHGYYGAWQECSVDYTGATPQHRFSMRLECPTDACRAGTTNRLKIIAQRAANDLPNWVRTADGGMGNGCGAVGFEAHGRNLAGKLVLPPELPNLDTQNQSGGSRQDVKTWNYEEGSFDVAHAGFLFKYGTTDFELRNNLATETFDVCYCDDDCTSPFNWFKVGQMRFTSFRLVSGVTNVASVASNLTIEYVNEPGVVAFERNILDYDVLGLQEGGMIKIVEDNANNMDDDGCRTAGYDWQTLINAENNGLDKATAPTLFAGKTTAEAPKRLAFNNGDPNNNHVTIKKAGVIAVCYCATVETIPMTGERVCGSPPANSWVLAARLTIRGPTKYPPQEWTFSSYVVFRFNFTGWGLTGQDTLRIIHGSSSCNDNDGEPSGNYQVTNIKVQCPFPCSEVGEITDVLKGDLSLNVLSSETYMCNKMNTDCRQNFIKEVIVLDENTTQLEFESPPGLKDGDLITLGDNIECNHDFPYCNDEKISVIKGLYRFADGNVTGDNHHNAADYYIAGHAVKTTSESKIVTIPVGWKDEVPRVQVVYKNGMRGRWTRHSEAETREEIMGTMPRQNMKVCWKYGHPTLGKYVDQAGIINLIDPNPLSYKLISLVSDVVQQTAPMIISFKTAGSQTGKRYNTIQGPTQLKIYFTETLALDVSFADGAVLNPNEGEDDIIEARQYICGKLFKEAWSDDDEFGFPMPRGCYYKVYGKTKELNMVFDAKNGLNSGKNYQLVVTGTPLDGAAIGGEYVQIYTMDDINIKPYEAIERGIARLDRTPKDRAYGSEGVKFLIPDGLKVIAHGGPQLADMMEMKGGADLQLALKGDPLGGGITAGAMLKIHLWPLLMWHVEKRCTAVCYDYDPVSAPCGRIQSCKGDATVPNFHQNYLELQLPATMSKMDQFISHMVAIKGLRLPRTGFFPTRLGAEIAQADGTKPHYMESLGDFLWKAPDEGQAVGKLVNVFGDGNARPFRGERGNVLYAVISNAATLFSAIQTGDAFMTIHLPEGYECVRTQDIDGVSPWRAEDDLHVFGGNIPQGSGSPNEGSGTRGWSVQDNKCVYTLRQNAVVYSGSMLTVRITVNNPPFPLKRESKMNRWLVELTSKGYHQWPVTLQPEGFKTGDNMANYSDNSAVLGRMTNINIVPLNLQRSIDENRIMMSRLYVFFQTEQETGVNASIQLLSPDGFSFPKICMAQNLPTQYYGARPGFETMRLPGIISCLYETEPFNHIVIKLTGSLLAGKYYAFETETISPFVSQDSHHHAWQLFTLTGNYFRVDGTPEPIEFVAPTGSLRNESELTGSSFTLCKYRLNTLDTVRFKMELDNMLPYNLKSDWGMIPRAATAKVFPLRIPPEIAGEELTLKIVAPEGFNWTFDDSNFLFRAFNGDPELTNVAPNVTADLPGGIPEVDPTGQGNVLLWKLPSYYNPNALYGFEAPIRVPDQSPTRSVSSVYVAFYKTGVNKSDACMAASFVPVGPVRALVNPKVDYVTNVESRANSMAFTIETISYVPNDGFLILTGPVGFQVQTFCTINSPPGERDSPYKVADTKALNMMLPEGVFCSSSVGIDGRITIRLTGKPLLPGRYRFSIDVINPNTPGRNREAAGSPCGYEHCWEFATTGPTGVPIDAPVACPNFEINSKMIQAIMPKLTEAQQAATGRNDRPTHKNPIVFAFKLESSQMNPGYLTISGPAGFEFDEDCLDDLELRGTEVFGPASELGLEYTPWNPEVLVDSCRGEGPNARLYVNPGISLGLRGDMLYPFRINVAVNPEKQPVPNKWTLDYGGESSDPFEGFTLWTFVRTSIRTVSTGTSTPVTGAPLLRNPITFTLRPFNTIRGAGMQIRVTGPPGFVIANVGGICSIMMQPVSADYISMLNAPRDSYPQPNYLGPPSLLWGQADVDCQVDTQYGNPAYMVATVLADNRELMANRDYQLTIFVNNPTINPPADQNFWRIETSDSPRNSPVLPLFRDEISLPGFQLNERARSWVYRNEDPATGQVFERGMTKVPGLYFEFQFMSKLEYGQEIYIYAPAGFEFPPNCESFRWEPIEAARLYLPNSPRTCDGGMMKFTIMEPLVVPQMTLVRFRIDTVNPPSTPHVMQNHWTVEVRAKPEDGADPGTGTIMGSEAVLSWTIKPQLQGTRIMLVGERKSAGSRSALAVSYIPVSDADELMLMAREPQGFDFTGARATSLSHEVISTNVEQIRVRASLYSGVQADIRIDGFKLGQLGGQTVWDLVTRLSNGEKMDESLGFLGGFRLPGALEVIEQSLLGYFQESPAEHPVSSTWMARTGEQALLQFEFKMSMRAEVGHMLRLRSPEYTLSMDRFLITRPPLTANDNPYVITAEVISIAGGEMIARLGNVMWPFHQGGYTYKVQLSVITPQLTNADAARWSIEILDGGALPVSTNDMLTAGFDLVEKVDVKVQTAWAPPMAEVPAEVLVEPRNLRPTEAIVVAPIGFNFTQDCLEAAGDSNEMIACARQDFLIAGRAVALLTFQPGGLVFPPSYMMIRIVTPADNGQDKSWYVLLRNRITGRQLGWGEDAIGVTIRQMLGAGVVYPGIPAIEGRMTFRFTTNEKIDEGGKLVVGYPKSFAIRCEGDYFSAVSLDGEVKCLNYPRQARLEVTMSRPLPPGQQAFAVTSTAPPAVKEENVFYIMVMSPQEKVVDAAMNVPGLNIQHGLQLAALPLTWSNSEPGRPSTVGFGFELLADLPEVNPPIMSEVVLTVPQDFQQSVRRTSHIEVLGEPLPLREGTWLDNSDPRSLRMFFDHDKVQTLAPGRYRWTFPVSVPIRLPSYNVYTMTICRPSTTNATCTGPRDPRALVAFPYPGFNLGEIGPGSTVSAQTAAAGRQARTAVWGIVLALLTPFLVLVPVSGYDQL